MRTPVQLPGPPGLLDINLHEIRSAAFQLPDIEGTMMVREEHLAPTGKLLAAAIVGLADTACGYGCLAALPPGKVGFATIELNLNLSGTARVGQRLAVRATAQHLGTSTQIWGARVHAESPGDAFPPLIAIFRCTQLLLDPQEPGSAQIGMPLLRDAGQ